MTNNHSSYYDTRQYAHIDLKVLFGPSKVHYFARRGLAGTVGLQQQLQTRFTVTGVAAVYWCLGHVLQGQANTLATQLHYL